MDNKTSGLHPVYQQLVSEWEAELEDTARLIFQSLRRAMPNGRTRRQLIWDVYGISVPDDEDLNNNRYDRKIRKTIEQMREDLIPIFSTSKEAGYKLDVSETSISMMVAEWEHRREKYTEKVNRGNALILRIRQAGEKTIPAELPVEPKQMGIWS
jgi:hypothetical protein